MRQSRFNFIAVFTAVTIAIAFSVFALPPSAAETSSEIAIDHPPVAVPPTLPPMNPPSGKPLTLDAFLAWDAVQKEAVVSNGIVDASFQFSLTNVSTETVTITGVITSCGCTAAKLPSQPWVLPPGSNGTVNVTMNVAGKFGLVIKTVTITSDRGIKQLYVRTSIISPTPEQMAAMSRETNQKLAMIDRQAVLKGDCAKCHVEPAVGRMGGELYATACGICHEGEHRASMVPDLHALKVETNPDYWRVWITHGKPGSIMPAFAKSQGGFLTEEQITSLVNYLSTAFPTGKTAQGPDSLPRPH